MSVSYADFLSKKGGIIHADGLDYSTSDLHPFLHEWQREIVDLDRWGLLDESGRATMSGAGPSMRLC